MKYAIHMLACLVAATAARADWPQYLGPDRNAMASDCRLARSWPEGGPRILWSFPLGRGYGGASVHRAEVFVLDRIANRSDVLRCIDFETGTEKRRYLYFNDLTHGMRCLSTEGKVMWAGGPDFQLGGFILADGLILNQHGKNGDLYLIEPSPHGYRELAKARLLPDKPGEPWAPLALSNGKLLIRDSKRMVCVDLRNPG